MTDVRRWVYGGLLVVVVLLRLASAAVPFEAGATFVLQPTQSQVTFTLASTLHTVRGTFAVTRGHLRLDGADGRVSGVCVVQAGSGDSGNRRRDSTMQREVLASAAHPELVFVPTQMRGTLAPEGLSTVEIDGTLSLRGVPYPLTITATVTILDERFTFATRFLVPYVAWGLPDPSTFLLSVDKQVEIRFEAVGTVTR